ncbi:unnamed protein product [Zymoseptoria tritici ST99CH_3D7]|uniref:Uncharacterized protein n=1 Tax=Zymoseptoria tritici (strain ST99CH_3D7) TaxID=1276538 RepID=A0A1X7RMN5_ZYMT9|nr:unnamed protein product [Zymoseptoria tritici ST99CH_3D7]
MNLDNASDANVNPTMLDPVTSERRYYLDPFTKISREIWRPGDGDGSQGTDYYDRQDDKLTSDQRWRLFQSDIGPIGQSKARPPKHVILDDHAVWDILKSDIPRSQLTRNWEHDFAGQGKIRARRPHRGRPAIKDDSADGDVKYHSVPFGAKNTLYIFTGEKDYVPVVYGALPPPQPTEEELQRKRRAESPPEYNPRAHGHNQHTPKDMLVKHGAPTFSKKQKPETYNLPRYTPQIPRGFGHGLGGQTTKPKASNSVTTPMGRQEQQLGSVQPGLAQPLQNSLSPTPIVHPSPLSNQAPDSDSDEELPLGRPKAPHDGMSAPSATVNRLTHDVPRRMPYIQRRAEEQKLAEQMMNRVENKQDVERIANELAEANVRLMDQDQEIGRLNTALALAQNDVAAVDGKVVGLEAEVLRLRQVNEAHDDGDL